MDNKTFCNVFPAFKGGAELDALFFGYAGGEYQNLRDKKTDDCYTAK